MIANLRKHDLSDHLAAVALESLAILRGFNIEDRLLLSSYPVEKLVVTVSLLHDIGKILPDFQKYIAKARPGDEDLIGAEAGRKTHKGPFHPEVSYLIARSFFSFGYEYSNWDEIVQHAIYWHHPSVAADRESLPKADQVRNALGGNNKFHSEYYKPSKELLHSSIMKLAKHEPEIGQDLLEYFDRPNLSYVFSEFPEYWPTSFDKDSDIEQQALKVLLSSCVIEADRRVSDLSLPELGRYLTEPRPIFKSFKVDEVPKYGFQTPRCKEQLDLAKSLVSSERRIQVLGADPGVGKTSIALYIHNETKPRSTFICLPRVAQIKGIYHTINKDKGRIFECGDRVSVETFYNSEQQESSHNGREVFDSDIVVTTFDRLLTPCFKRSIIQELIVMLSSNLVLDEFHDFANLPRMLIPLKVILRIRSWCNNDCKTLLMSGTPEPALVRYLGIPKGAVVSRTSLSPVHTETAEFTYAVGEPDNLAPDSIYATNRVEKAQALFLQEIPGKYLIHSYFCDEDLEGKIDHLLKKFCRNTSENNSILISSKMLEASLDLHLKNLYCELGLPSGNCQLLGRKNRFGGKPGGVVRFFSVDDDFRLFNSNIFGHKKTARNWKAFLTKKLGSPKNFSHREAMIQLYDEFWEDPKHLSDEFEYLSSAAKEGIKKLQDWFPRRQKTKDTKEKRLAKAGRSFRGASMFATCRIVDDYNKVIGQLWGKDLITISNDYEIDQYQDATRAAAKTKDRAKKLCLINGEKVFDYSNYQKFFGYSDLRPLVMSHEDDTIDIVVQRALGDKRDRQKVYNKTLGVVTTTLMEDYSQLNLSDQAAR